MLDPRGQLGRVCCEDVTWRGHGMETPHSTVFQQNLGLPSVRLCSSQSPKGGAVADKTLLLSRMVEWLVASWCGQVTIPALLCPLPRLHFGPFLLGGLRRVTCPLHCMASVSGQGLPPQHQGLGANKAPRMLEDAQAGHVVDEQSHTGPES